MQFRDAILIARENLGFLVTRNELGDFVVVRPDGTTVGGATSDETQEGDLRKELDLWRFRCQRSTLALEEASRSHRAELVGLEVRVAQVSSELADERRDHEITRTALARAEARIAKVSDAEWERVREADAKLQEERAVALRLERRVLTCSCRGEVENCVRCSGGGTYVTDGYGNIT